MLVPDSWNVIYRVAFDGDNQNLQDDFETKEEAIEYAKSHMEEMPIVSGIEVLCDEFGNIIDEEAPEVIFSYMDEAEEIPEEPETNELDARLNELENWEVSDEEEEEARQDAEAEFMCASVRNIDPRFESLEEDKKEAEEEIDDEYKDVEPIKVFDPFACDFSDISEDEEKVQDAIDGTLDPVEFLNDLAATFGIEDKVEIKPAEEEIPEVEEAEVVIDRDMDFPEPVDDAGYMPVEKPDFTIGSEFDIEEPKTEVVVTAEVPEEVVDNMTTDEVKVGIPTDEPAEEVVAAEAPKEMEVCDGHLCDEKPAEKIAKCHACPECGKEICECNKTESLEATVPEDLTDNRQPEEISEPEIKDEPVDYKKEVAEEKGLLEARKDLSEVPGEVAYVLKQHIKELNDKCSLENKESFDEVTKYIVDTINTEAIDTAAKRRTVLEFENSSDTDKTSLLQHIWNVILGAQGMYTNPNKKWKHAYEELSEGLREIASSEAVFNLAELQAKENNTPVIYGFNKDGKYIEIVPHVFCNDIKKCTAEIEKKYKPSGSILVAYPDQDFVGGELEPAKFTLSEDVEEEMSDLELAEKLKAALKEKHCK